MSFGIYTAGDKEHVLEQVRLAPGYGDTSQLERVKEFILAELNDAPDGKDFAIECSGHHDSYSRNVTINFRTYPRMEES